MLKHAETPHPFLALAKTWDSIGFYEEIWRLKMFDPLES